jgi:predicted RNA-binding protein associated with RNAse of E/G family
MAEQAVLASGQWQSAAHLLDYRAEWLGDVLVERATWSAAAPVLRLHDTVIAAPGAIWLRFWLMDGDQVVEKYFDAAGAEIGYYVPICLPLVRQGRELTAQHLLLALWLQHDGRLRVHHEAAFDTAVITGRLSPVAVEHAEQRIRTLTTAITQQRFPAGLVRSFQVQLDQTEGHRP